MISFERVYQTYPGHKLLTVESIWFPFIGWLKPEQMQERSCHGQSFTRIVERAQREGAKMVQLMLQEPRTWGVVFADFSITELVEP